MKFVDLEIVPDSRGLLKLDDKTYQVNETIKVPSGFNFTVSVIPSPKAYFLEWETSGIEIKDKYNKQQDITVVSKSILKPILTDIGLNIEIEGNGKVKIDGTNYSSGSSLPLIKGREYTIEAVADNGYVFSEWSSSIYTFKDPKNPIQKITIDKDTTITALFKQKHKLTFRTQGNGKIKIGRTYYASVNSMHLVEGREYTLEAVVDNGHVFSGWSSSTYQFKDPSNPIQKITIDKDTTITAVFVEKGPILNVQIEGNGKVKIDGTYYSSGSSIFLTKGREYTIEAIADNGYVFYEWSSSIYTFKDPKNPIQKITLDKDTTIKAVFKQHILDIQVEGNGKVKIDGTYRAPNYFIYIAPGEHTIEAIADNGYVFYEWSITPTYQFKDPSNPIQKITIDKDTTIKAVFKQKHKLHIAGNLYGIVGRGDGMVKIDDSYYALGSDIST